MPEEVDQVHVNGTSQPTDITNAELPVKHRRTGTDPEAQEMVIASLRSQIQDLFSQVNELNNKLVKSYDRVSDLEDDLHVSSANTRSSSLRISQLELERTQHLAALNTGLLVEKAHVTSELNRLMEKATEEAAQRGQAESARRDIEKDLDDLSASLFAQANSMVAEARLARHLSERKVDDAERALKGAEEMVGLMQVQMQALQAGNEDMEKKMHEMQVAMGKGKWNERVHQQTVDLSRPLKLLSFHVPYQEFLMFVAHIRSLHQTSLNVPAMPTLLPLPFLARISTEDSEPTIRLDLAPALNWLSRRSVLAAIYSGQLTIEPIPVSALFSETALYASPATVAGISTNTDNVNCALCGAIIVSATEYAQSRRRPSSLTNSGNYSWSGSFFKKTSLSNTSHPSSPTNPVAAPQVSRTPSSQQGPSQHQQVYIFRVAASLSTTSTISSALPIPSLSKSLSQGSPSPMSSAASPSAHASPVSSPPNNQPMTIYPLCSSGWCLLRLRTTCTLWSFIRTGIIDKVWEEEIPFVPSLPPPTIALPTRNNGTAEKPPIPPPRKRGIWGIASAIGERAASWGDSDKKSSAPALSTSSAAPVLPPRTSVPVAGPEKAAPPPPLPPRRESAQQQLRRVPPPPVSLPSPVSAPEAVPPPLPKRREVSKRASVTALNGGEGEDGGPNAPSNPSTPTRVVFDATAPPSPMQPKSATLPAMTTIEGTIEKEEDGAKEEKVETKEEDVATEVGEEAKNTPANIPLPKSPPHVANDRDLPIRIGSPIVAPAATGTPPPLPRRAAARRAVPPTPGADGNAGSRPATPSRPERKRALIAVVEKEGITSEGEKKDEGEKVEGALSGSQGTFSSEQEAAVVSSAEKAEEEEKEDVAAEESKRVDEAKVKAAVEMEAEIDLVRPESLASSTDDDDDDVFVDAPATSTTNDHHSKRGIPNIVTTATSPRVETEHLVRASMDEGLSELEGSSAPAAESPVAVESHDEVDSTLGEVYIGDATWEERAWKELVKLKEDMFWARIGGWR